MKSHTKGPANGPIADTMSQTDGHAPHVRLGLLRKDLWTTGLLYIIELILYECRKVNTLARNHTGGSEGRPFALYFIEIINVTLPAHPPPPNLPRPLNSVAVISRTGSRRRSICISYRGGPVSRWLASLTHGIKYSPLHLVRTWTKTFRYSDFVQWRTERQRVISGV